MARPKGDDLTRILGYLEIGDCWECIKGVQPNGYGKTYIGSGDYKVVLVHRYVYEQLVGPIPAGLVLDHLCKNRKCANPDHLEPVTPGENIRRGASSAAAEVTQDPRSA
jgi:hypothetical protein